MANTTAYRPEPPDQAGRPVELSDGIPRLPRVYLPRTRLWQRLDEATQGAVTLLVAPPGAGKTLGVGGWLRSTARTDDVVWLHSDSTWGPERMLPLLEKAAGGPAGIPALVVVDDAHVLPSATLRLIDARLNQAPESLRLLLLSRWDLPLTRLVPELLGHFTIVRGDVLRVADADAASLIAGHARTDADEVVDAITSRCQGWCAALVLTARAVGALPDPVAAVRRWPTDGPTVADRVASEVFSALHSRERHLLLCVADEEIVTISTAAHLSRDPGAQDVLAGLEATGLMVTRLPADDGHSAYPVPPGSQPHEDPRYRIHPLLTEVVRRRLDAGGVVVAQARATVVRAVRLDLARGETRHSFARLVAVGAVDEAAQMLGVDGIGLVMRGRGSLISDFVRRRPDAVESHPESWFAVALQQWVEGDTELARHWMDRLLLETGDDGADSLMRACIRLMRGRLGLEPITEAVAGAQQALQAVRSAESSDAVLPVLHHELGITQNWLGELSGAEESLATSIRLARNRNLPALAISSMTHLAFTEYMQGRERACVEIATEALQLMDPASPRGPGFSRTRAELAYLLADLCDVTRPTQPIDRAVSTGAVHAADLCTTFWLRMRGARLALMDGSVATAQRLLETPLDVGPLPAHLHGALLIEQAFLASLATDHTRLEALQQQLIDLGSPGEAELVAGLLADVVGDRRSAAAHFSTALDHPLLSQPATRALALTCRAQLLDALGNTDEASASLQEAAIVTEVRRNSVPFLGWSRQGTPVETLLARLDGRASTPWVSELSRALAGRPDVTTVFAPTTATPQERASASEILVVPALSPREREVLNELARGSTYADIAAHLFVSENTVKTHVSSLYGKLSAKRRSQALAVARSLHLL